MLTFDPPVVLELDTHRVIGWRQLEGVTLAVRRGRVWVTHAHDLDDHFVLAGERLALRPADRVVIEADGGPAQIALLPMPTGTRSRAIRVWLARQRRLALPLPGPAASAPS